MLQYCFEILNGFSSNGCSRFVFVMSQGGRFDGLSESANKQHSRKRSIWKGKKKQNRHRSIGLIS